MTPNATAPLRAEVLGVREERTNGVGDEISVLDEPQPRGLGIEVIDGLGGDPDLDIVDVELCPRRHIEVVGIDRVAIGVVGLERGLRLLDNRLLDHVPLLVDLLAVDSLGWTVELGITEESGRARVVDDVKRDLSPSGNSRVPRPMICLKRASEPMGRNRTMLRTVGRSTPVESNWDVVAITGRSFSVSAKSLR
ncbi:MAG TPA: hypothetical protein VK672_01205 [Solirubrobacteraceae bacterium]|nr:hypothetical protein [Solirubrobacteraceae bacterium]